MLTCLLFILISSYLLASKKPSTNKDMKQWWDSFLGSSDFLLVVTELQNASLIGDMSCILLSAFLCAQVRWLRKTEK